MSSNGKNDRNANAPPPRTPRTPRYGGRRPIRRGPAWGGSGSSVRILWLAIAGKRFSDVKADAAIQVFGLGGEFGDRVQTDRADALLLKGAQSDSQQSARQAPPSPLWPHTHLVHLSTPTLNLTQHLSGDFLVIPGDLP